MPMTFSELGFGGMTIDEKLEMVGQLWEDLIASVPPGGLLTKAQQDELRQRVADAAARPDDWVAWEDALPATLKRLAGR
jgi:putative addiction module component (TIGR02574 family)